MNPAILSLLFDGTLALLLVITIGYCSKLSRRIRTLQDGRSELAEMITRFDKSTERATAAMAELQTVSKKITEGLQLKIDKANFLADDLAFLIEKSSKLATQLEQLQKQRSEPAKAAFSPATSFAAQTFEPVAHERTQPKPAAPAKSGLEQLIAASGQPQSPSVASIEAMLQKLAAPPPSAAKRPLAEPEPRTNAERELLSALKTGRG